MYTAIRKDIIQGYTEKIKELANGYKIKVYPFLKIKDEDLAMIIAKTRNKASYNDHESFVSALVDTILEVQGGHLVFIDDLRNVEDVTNEQGLYVHTKTLRHSVLLLEILANRNLDVKHIFFDYWLGDFNTKDAAFGYIMINETKQPSFTCHSSDVAMRGVIEGIMAGYTNKPYRSIIGK